MNHIKSFNKYNTDEYIFEGWLGDKLKKLSAGMKAALQAFTKPFKDVINQAKKEWSKGVKAEEIKQTLMASLETSFSNAMKSIDKIDNPEDVSKIYDDFIQAIIQLDDTLTKELESIKESIYFTINESSVEANVAGAKAVVDNILGSIKTKFEDAKLKYQQQLAKSVELDKKKKEAKNYIHNLYNEIKTNIKNVDVDALMNDAKEKIESESGTTEYKSGQQVTYKKKDGSENKGEISEDQDGVEDGYIKIFTESNPTGFAIDKSNIKDVSDPDNKENYSDNIKTKLTDIKNDKNKMSRVSNFLKFINDDNKMKEVEKILSR